MDRINRLDVALWARTSRRWTVDGGRARDWIRGGEARTKRETGDKRRFVGWEKGWLVEVSSERVATGG